MSFTTTEPAFRFRQGTRPLLINVAFVALLVASSSTPNQSSFAQTWRRKSASRSPIPPQNTSASNPPNAAVKLPISRRMRSIK